MRWKQPVDKVCINLHCSTKNDEYAVHKQKLGVKKFRFCMHCRRGDHFKRWKCNGCTNIISDHGWQVGTGRYFCSQKCPEQIKRKRDRSREYERQRSQLKRAMKDGLEINIVDLNQQVIKATKSIKRATTTLGRI